VLEWVTSIRPPTIDGLTRVHASMHGNALLVGAKLGVDVKQLADDLIRWQWPDGGWNCDRNASGRRSSFHESLPPAWGLWEFWRATGATWARDAARRTGELFLDHRLFRATTSGEVINRAWLALHYPPYWHYDILQALLILSRMGLADDDRCGDALDVLVKRRRKDGRWHPGGYWWSASGVGSRQADVVDWGRSRPNEMITLNALRVLKAAGRSAGY
jgi:hypothetical protein